MLVFILPSINYSEQVTAANSSNNQNIITPETIFNNVDSYFKDSKYGGYYDAIDTNGNIVSNVKYCSDYLYALDVISKIAKNLNDNSLLNYIPKYINFVDKFEGSNGGYIGSVDFDWQKSTNYIDSITMSFVLQTYSNLYAVTGNTTYLAKALDLYNLFQNHFYDSVHGGYHYQLNQNDFLIMSTQRKTGYYGTIADSFLDLYQQTNDLPVLISGFSLLNQTINRDFDSTYNYFVPYLTESTNTPDTGSTFWWSDQMNLAESLLRYSAMNELTAQVGSFKDRFISIADKIYSNIVKNLLNNNLVMINYDVVSKVKNTAIDAVVQAQFYDFLLLRKLYDPNFNQFDQNLLEHGSSILSTFLGPRTNLFFRSSENQITSPWVNYAILKTILDLEGNSISAPLQYQTNSAPNFITSTYIPTNTNNNDITTALVIGIIIVGLGYLAYRNNKKYPDRETTERIVAKSSNLHPPTSKLVNLSSTTQIYKQTTCETCSNPILVNDIFCQNCGTRVK